jgi:hypothetical protein
MGPDSAESAARLIVLHIPKTGGRTLNQHFRHYEPESVVPIGESNPFSLACKPDRRVPRLREKPPETLETIRVIKGHQRFGVHAFLPGRSVYVALLRDPVSRVLSVHNHLLHWPRYDISSIVRTEYSDPLAFVRSGLSLEVDNGQTRRVSGVDPPSARHQAREGSE